MFLHFGFSQFLKFVTCKKFLNYVQMLLKESTKY